MIIILVFLICSVIAQNCEELGQKFLLPIKYHKGGDRTPEYFERVLVKKEGKEIGDILPGGDIWEIYPYRLFGYITHSQEYIKLNFKASVNNTNGKYNFILVLGWNQWEHLGEIIYTANRPTPRRSPDYLNFAIIEHENGFTCGPKRNKTIPAFWNVIWKGSLIVMQTNNNHIDKSRVSGFTKMYCETSLTCEVSNIFKSNGREEDLTWESDYRYTKVGFKSPTIKRTYNTSMTDWYITPLIIPTLQIFKSTHFLMETTQKKNIYNMNNTGTSLIWMDDKIRLEFTGRSLKSSYTLRSVKKNRQFNLIWIEYIPPKHQHQHQHKHCSCNNGNIIKPIILLILLCLAPPPPHLSKKYNGRFKLIFFSYINPN